MYAKAKPTPEQERDPPPSAPDSLRREPSPHEQREYDKNEQAYWDMDRR